MSPERLRRTFSATLDAVDGYCAELRRRLLRRLPREERFVVELLVREALLNAVVHGGGRNPRNEVTCSVRRLRREIRIAVADPGPGFDWRSWRASQAAASAPSGRGLDIVHAYADEVRFNEDGNRLEILRRLEGNRHGN